MVACVTFLMSIRFSDIVPQWSSRRAEPTQDYSTSYAWQLAQQQWNIANAQAQAQARYQVVSPLQGAITATWTSTYVTNSVMDTNEYRLYCQWALGSRSRETFDQFKRRMAIPEHVRLPEGM